MSIAASNHPLAFEIAGLKAAVSRYQDEAHSAAIKLQRFSLDTSNAHDRLVTLERENTLLREELDVLRSQDTTKAPSSEATVQDLTLSLRKLSERLSLTEESLSQRTTHCSHLQGEVSRLRQSEQNAYALAASARGREEEGKERVRQLELQVRHMNQQVTMSDLALNEYANLVRSIEKRPSSESSSSSPSEKADTARAELERIAAEFAQETRQLHAEIARLNESLIFEQSKATAHLKGAEDDRVERAKAFNELEKYRLDDRTATKMVSRYMKFSQMSTNTLQETLEALKARHAVTINTMSSQIHDLSSRLASSDATTTKLRDALDELGRELVKEGFGRRREVSLRIKMLSREEQFEEGLRRLLRRTEENKDVERTIQDLRTLLSLLSTGSEELSSSESRLLAAETAVNSLTEELQTLAERKFLPEGVFVPAVIVPRVNGSAKKGPPQKKVVVAANAKPIPPALPSLDPKIVSSAINGAPAQNELETQSLDDTENSSPAEPDPTHDDIFNKNATNPSLNGVSEEGKEQVHAAAEPLPEFNAASAAPTLDKPPEITVTQADDTSDGVPDVTAGVPVHIEDNTVSAMVLPQKSIEPVSPSRQDTSPAIENGADSSLPPPPPIESPAHISLTAEENVPIEELSSPPSIVVNGETALPKAPEPKEEPEPVEDIPTVELPEDHQVAAVASQPDINETQDAHSDAADVPVTDVSEVSQPAEVLPEPSPNDGLIVELQQVSNRYDDLQRSFRDCHLALQELRESLSSPSSSPSDLGPSVQVQTAVERLNDYTEDARVELEIRIADEVLVARGFETLLSLSLPMAEDGEDDMQEDKIRAFISGEDANVQKTRANLEKKLGDVQHDIAILKRFLHEGGETESPAAAPPAPIPTPQPRVSSNSWFGRPSRPASPAPTFGDVITTPGLRKTPSYSKLGLKIAMPSTKAVPNVNVETRTRKTSTMYMLGLGRTRSSSNFRTQSMPVQGAPQPVEEAESAGDDIE